MLQIVRNLIEWLKGQARREEAAPPEDPYADRPVPVMRGPKGRSGAVAVAEPDEDDEQQP